jgi:hypothetical protein
MVLGSEEPLGLERELQKDSFFAAFFFVRVLLSQGCDGGVGFFFGHRGLSVTTSTVPRTSLLVPVSIRFKVVATVGEDFSAPDDFDVPQPSAPMGPAEQITAKHSGNSTQRKSFMAILSQGLSFPYDSDADEPVSPAAEPGAEVSQKPSPA